MSEKLKKLYTGKSDYELIEIVNHSLDDFTTEAKKVILDELKKRKIKTKLGKKENVIPPKTKIDRKTDTLIGIKGFLLIFVFWLIILLVSNSISFFKDLYSEKSFSIFDFISVSIIIYLLIGIYGKKRKTILYVRIFLIMSILYSILKIAMLIYLQQYVDYPKYVINITPIIWLRYFYISERVKTTLIK